MIVPPLLMLVAVIHLLPVVGVGGRAPLERLYGTATDEPNLLLLMRHRAVLFGLLGAFLLAAAFDPRLHLAGLAVGLASVGSFLLLACRRGGLTDQVRRVCLIDAVAAVLLVAGLIVQLTTSDAG
ncbi:MAG: phosphopantetheine adenylyltransferase [Planctomycetota bacterium]